jgi:hypothetical protein
MIDDGLMFRFSSFPFFAYFVDKKIFFHIFHLLTYEPTYYLDLVAWLLYPG